MNETERLIITEELRSFEPTIWTVGRTFNDPNAIEVTEWMAKAILNLQSIGKSTNIDIEPELRRILSEAVLESTDGSKKEYGNNDGGREYALEDLVNLIQSRERAAAESAVKKYKEEHGI
jgi:hypothetical protein